MQTAERLGPDDLKAVVLGYRDALRQHQESINRLNVYPVPDGDTGTNMALTLESVVGELNGESEMAAVCHAISHGSLMGARGNSGVILSQILRGVAKQFAATPDGADGRAMAEALAHAADAAYQAVMRPVEGTILTVARAAAEGASEGNDLVDVLERARAAAADALARTPELLSVLADAGVVDAGGAGFLLLLDAFLHVADGRPIPEATDGTPPAPAHGAAATAADSAVGDLRYEVMFLLEADDATLPAFRDVWSGIGDSIVVVGGDGMWNCHIHTDDIGAAIEAGIDAGRPRRIRVTDLLEQVEEERWVRDAPPSPEEGGPGILGAPVATGVVTVVTGAGVGRLFRSVGVQAIVAGGQSMNPSTAQILEAVDACPADAVVVLPNNPNIVPVAREAAALSTKDVRVVPTRSLTEGLAAAFAYDPEGTADANAAAMATAVDRVVTGEVTAAVRDAWTPAGQVRAGEYLGVTREGPAVVAATMADAAVALVRALAQPGHEIVTVLEGDGATAAATRHITESLALSHPELMVEVHHGGQPLYPYLFSVE
ncbi:MAG TPA: DAK2 domain-containing protein [Acidimicrobiales bacterium]|nr:DAK2 domain-containing protein [Acidimicrobiales bacterium]